MKSNKNDSFDMNDSAFLSEEDDFMSQDLENLNTDGPVKKAAKLVFDTSKAVGSGVLHGLKTTLDDKVEGFSEAYDNITGIGEDISTGISEAFDETKKAWQTSKRIALSLLPMTKGIAPKGIYSGLEKFFKKNLPELEDTTSDEARMEKQQEEQITSTITDVFKASQKLEGERALHEANDRQLSRMFEQHSHRQNMSVMSSIDRHAHRISNFLGTTYTSYLKKDLELKYRGYFIAKDTLRYVKGLSSTFEQKLEAIKINTSLPEQVKIDHSDTLNKRKKESGRGVLSQYSRNVMPQLSKNINKALTGTIKSVNKDMLPMIQSSMEALGDVAGMGAVSNADIGNWLLNKVVGWGSGLIFKRLTTTNPKLANIVKIMSGDAKAINEGMSTFMNGAKKFMSNMGLDKIADIIPGFERESQTGENITAKNPEGAAVFDNLVHDTITTAIPKHLERIGDTLEALTNSMDVKVTKDVQKAWDPTNPLHLSTIESIQQRSHDRKYGTEADQGRFTALQKAKTQEILKVALGLDKDADLSKNERWQNIDKNWGDFAEVLTKSAASGKGIEYDTLRKFAGLQEGKLSRYDETYLKELFGNIDDKAVQKAKLILSAITDERTDAQGNKKLGYVNSAAFDRLRDVSKSYGKRAEGVQMVQDKEHKLGLDAYDEIAYFDNNSGTFHIDNARSDKELSRDAKLQDMVYRDRENRQHTYKAKDQAESIKGEAAWFGRNMREYDDAVKKQLFDPNNEKSIAHKIEKEKLYEKYGFASTDDMVRAMAESRIPGVKSLMAILSPSMFLKGRTGAQKVKAGAEKAKDWINNAGKFVGDFEYKVAGESLNAIVDSIEQDPAKPYLISVHIRPATEKDKVYEQTFRIDIPMEFRDIDVDTEGMAKGLSYERAEKIAKDYFKKNKYFNGYHFEYNKDIKKNWKVISYPANADYVDNLEENRAQRAHEEMEQYYPTAEKSNPTSERARTTAGKSSIKSLLDSLDQNVRTITETICGTSYAREEDLEDTIDEAKIAAEEAIKPEESKSAEEQETSLWEDIKSTFNSIFGSKEEKQEKKEEKKEPEVVTPEFTVPPPPTTPKVDIPTTTDLVRSNIVIPEVEEAEEYKAKAKSPFGIHDDNVIDAEVITDRGLLHPYSGSTEEPKSEKTKDKTKPGWFDKAKSKFGSIFNDAKAVVKESWAGAKDAFNKAMVENKAPEATEQEQPKAETKPESKPVEEKPEQKAAEQTEPATEAQAPKAEKAKRDFDTINFQGEAESRFHSDFRVFANQLLAMVPNIGGGSGFGKLGETVGKAGGLLGAVGKGALKATGAVLKGGAKLAGGALGLIPSALTGGAHLLFGNEQTGSRGLIRNGADLLFGNAELGKKGLVPGALAFGSNLLFGNKDKGTRGLVGGTKDLLFGKEGEQGLVQKTVGGAKNLLFGNKEAGTSGIIGGTLKAGKNFLFGNKETGSRGIIRGTKDVLFGNEEKGTKGIIPGAFKAGKSFLFGDKEKGTKGVLGGLPKGFKNIKAKLFGGDDSEGKNHIGIVKKTVNFVKRLFSSDGPKYVDIYRKDDTTLGHCLLKISEQEAGVFLADENGGIGPRLERSRDINRPVLKANGDTIIKKEDIDAGLVDKEGHSIYDPKKSLLSRMFSGAKRLAGKVIHKVSKAFGRLFKGSDDEDDDKEEKLNKSTFLGRRLGFTPNGPFQDKVLEYLDIISKKMGTPVKTESSSGPDQETTTDKPESKPAETEKQETSTDVKQQVADKVEELTGADKAKASIKNLFTSRKSDDELYEQGYVKLDDTQWIDGSGNIVPEADLRKDGKLKSAATTAKSKVFGMFGKIADKAKSAKASAAKAVNDATEKKESEILDKANFVQADADLWYDQDTGESYSYRDAVKAAKSKKISKPESKPAETEDMPKSFINSAISSIKNVFSNGTSSGPKAKEPEYTEEFFDKIKTNEEDYDPEIAYYDKRWEEEKAKANGEMTPYEKRMIELTEANMAVAKATQAATEKTAEETTKANEAPDVNGTVNEEGSAADQKRDAEEAAEKRKKKLEEREAKRQKAKEEADEKEKKKRKKGKNGEEEEEPSWLSGYTKKITNFFGRKFKLFGTKTLRKFGLNKAARVFGKKGLTGLLKHGVGSGLRSLGGGLGTAGGLGALALGALGGGMGFAGSRSSGASGLSSAVSAGAGGIAGLAALSNPVTAGIAASVMAANAMREGWNDDKTLKKSWGGTEVADYKKGSTAAGNLLNYASFGLLNKYGGRKYVDKAMQYTSLGHMVGGVGGTIAGVGDMFGSAAEALKGDNASMNDLELKRARAKLKADINRGIQGAAEKSQQFEEAVKNGDWKTARNLSKQHVDAGKTFMKGLKRTAKGALAVATGGMSSMIEMGWDKLFGEENKPMDEKEIEAARKKIEAMRKKGRSGAKELGIQFEEAIAGENWATARKLVKMEDKGVFGAKLTKGAGLRAAMTGGLSLLFESNDENPLSEKEIKDFRDRCEKSIKAGNTSAQKILDRFNDAVEMQDWKKARKVSNMKDKSVAKMLAGVGSKIFRYTSPIGWFFSDQDEPMTEKEIDDFRKKMDYLKSQGDAAAQPKLDKFEMAVLKQEWALARKISHVEHKSVMANIGNALWDWNIGDEDKPMDEKEIQDFVDSMNRKIELGDGAAKERLAEFQDAVGRQQWRRAREISNKHRDGIWAKMGKGIAKGAYYASGAFLLVGDDNSPMSDDEINKFKERMQGLIDQGDPIAKNKLAQFEDAVLDGSWKRARAIANMKDTGLLQKATKWAVNLFNDEVKEVDDKQTDESDVAQRYRLILSRVKEAMYKTNIDSFGRHLMAELRNEMQDADLTDLTDEKLDGWAKRLEQIDRSCGDLSTDSAKAYEAERKKKQKLLEQQQLLLKEIVASQERCGIFEFTKRSKLKKLFGEVEALPLEELEQDILNSYDEDLRLLDSSAMSTKPLDEAAKKKVQEMMKRQSSLSANIEDTYEKLSFWNFSGKKRLNMLRDEVNSALLEELDTKDFDEWDAELKDIDPMAKSSRQKSPEEMKKFKEMLKKKGKLKSMIEDSKDHTKWLDFSKRSALGKILDDMQGTNDDELDDDAIKGWEDDYKAADENAKTVEEAEQEDKEHKQLLRDKRRLRMAIRKTIRKHRKDDVGWFEKDIAKECQGLVNHLDAIDDENFTPEMFEEIKAKYAELDADAAAEINLTKVEKEPPKQEEKKPEIKPAPVQQAPKAISNAGKGRYFRVEQATQHGWYDGSKDKKPTMAPTIAAKSNGPVDRYGRMMGRTQQTAAPAPVQEASAQATQATATATSPAPAPQTPQVNEEDRAREAAHYQQALDTFNEWKDKPSSPERTAALKSVGCDFPDDPDDLNDTANTLKAKVNEYSKPLHSGFFDKLKDMGSSVIGGIKDKFASVKDKVSSVKDSITDTVGNSFIGKAFGKAKSAVSDMAGKAKDAVANSFIGKTISDAKQGISDFVDPKIASLKAKYDEKVGNIGDKIREQKEALKEQGSSLIASAKDKVSGLLNKFNPFASEEKTEKLSSGFGDFFKAASMELKQQSDKHLGTRFSSLNGSAYGQSTLSKIFTGKKRKLSDDYINQEVEYMTNLIPTLKDNNINDDDLEKWNEMIEHMKDDNWTRSDKYGQLYILAKYAPDQLKDLLEDKPPDGQQAALLLAWLKLKGKNVEQEDLDRVDKVARRDAWGNGGSWISNAWNLSDNAKESHADDHAIDDIITLYGNDTSAGYERHFETGSDGSKTLVTGEKIGRTLEDIKAERAAAKENKPLNSNMLSVARDLANQSVETAISTDAKGKVTDITKGDMFSVDAPMNKGGAVIHNHPDGTGTSMTDIESAQSAGLDSLTTIRPKFNSGVVGKIAELEAEGRKYKLNSLYDQDTNTVELKPGIEMKKTDLGNAIAETVDLTKSPKPVTTETNGELNSFFGELSERVGGIGNAIMGIGNGSISQEEVLRGIYERLGDIIAAIGEHNVTVNNNIGSAAKQTFDSMKQYADFEFKKEDHTPPKPAMKQSTINISK